MPEIDDLHALIAEGFRPATVLRSVGEDECRRNNLVALDYMHALPLSHPDGRQLMYYLRQSDAIILAQQLVEEQRAVTGYSVCVYCSAVGPETIEGHTVYLRDVAASLKEHLGWKVKVSEYPHTIEILFDIQGYDRSKLEACLDDVSKVTLALALRNRVGFVVGNHSEGTTYKGQPFSIKMGLQERYCFGIKADDLATLTTILADDDALTAIHALQLFYSEVTERARITVAWSAIETLLDAGHPEHLLDKTEMKAVLTAVAALECVHPAKRKRLREQLSDSSRTPKYNRNERIAHKVSVLLHQDYTEAYKRIRALTAARGKRVHRLSLVNGSLGEHLNFVETLLFAYIESRCPGTISSFEDRT